MKSFVCLAVFMHCTYCAAESYSELKAKMAGFRYSREVVDALETFVEGDCSDEDRSAATKTLARWRRLAGSVNYGGKWSTAQQVAEMRGAGKAMRDEASALIDVRQYKLAITKLLKAKKADPEDIEADFTLGMLYALVRKPTDSTKARRYFSSAIKRLESIGKYRDNLQEANLQAAKNNAAIADMRIGDHRSAVRRWAEVCKSEKLPPEFVQNIGRMASCNTRFPYMSIDEKVTRDAVRLYASVAGKSDKEYDYRAGWLYAMPTVEVPEEEKKEKLAAIAGGLDVFAKMEVFATGTGFVVAPGVILTNKHVTEGALQFKFKIDGEPVNGVTGTTLAVSDKWDLALIEADGTDMPAVSISGEEPRLGGDVKALGYPMTNKLGDGLKVTGGSYAGEDKDGHYLVDVLLDHGNSGGPLIDLSGSAVGVNTFGIKAGISTYGGCVPGHAALEFLKESGIKPTGTPIAEGAPWADAIESVGQSTLMISCYGLRARAVWVGGGKRPDAGGREVPKGWNGLEDNWCMNCSGLGYEGCGDRKCKHGAYVSRKRVPFTMPDGRPSYRTETVRKRCSTCGGDGTVSCRWCNYGKTAGTAAGISGGYGSR